MNDRSGIVLLKLGGSLITDKTRPETPRPEVIARLAEEVRAAAAQLPGALVVGHGSGSFGHVAASRHGLVGGRLDAARLPGICATQDQAARLHRLVVAALRAAGALPFSLAPSSLAVAAGGEPRDLWLEPLHTALDRGLLPVVYGDVLLDTEWGASICSTETLLLALARRLGERGRAVRRALWLGETDGVQDEGGALIATIHAAEVEGLLERVGGSRGTDVTGGMRHRLETAGALARLGVDSWIGNGLVPGLLGRALRGEPVPGTLVVSA
jgi:isopentenyl phosphate kinase